MKKLAFTIALILTLPATCIAGEDKIPLPVPSMGTLTVTGSQLQTLQAIKAALHRVHSTRPADADKLVCSFNTITGSMVRTTLDCETNRQWWAHTSKVEIAMTQALSTSHAGGSGGKAVPLGRQMVIALQNLTARNMAFAATINKVRFEDLMNHLPMPSPAENPAD